MATNTATLINLYEIPRISKGRIRTGQGLTGLAVAFLLFDAMGKFVKPAPVVEAFAQTGWPIETATTIGAILLVCTLLSLIPRTSVMGAVLLTGYLGGAVAANLRLLNPLFSHTLFPVYFGVLIWTGPWLRRPELIQLVYAAHSPRPSWSENAASSPQSW